MRIIAVCGKSDAFGASKLAMIGTNVIFQYPIFTTLMDFRLETLVRTVCQCSKLECFFLKKIDLFIKFFYKKIEIHVNEWFKWIAEWFCNVFDFYSIRNFLCAFLSYRIFGSISNFFPNSISFSDFGVTDALKLLWLDSEAAVSVGFNSISTTSSAVSKSIRCSFWLLLFYERHCVNINKTIAKSL